MSLDENHPPRDQRVSIHARRRRLWISSGLIVALAVCAVAVTASTRARAHAHAVDAYAAAVADLRDALEDADGVADVNAAALVPADQVTDPETFTALATAVGAVSDLPRVPESGADAPWRSWSTEDLDGGARDLRRITVTTRSQTADRQAAAAAVLASHDAWLLDQARTDHDAAHGELVAAVDAAAALLTASEGHVLDDASRLALSAAIDAAGPVRDTAADAEDTAALTAAAVTTREHVAALAAAQQAVVDAQAAWQAEQDRVAAEHAAAAAAASSGRKKTPTATSGGSSAPRGGGGAGSSGAGTGAGSPSPAAPAGGDGSHWSDTSSGPDLCHSGDTSGGSWEC
ncbi:hypothetical protein [Cellulomonas hominis]|uniref:hypothetical protein n=1 Tax=Cellulomonas hominis TaxID=156981 RepID=UPI001B917279|nr:hypothetical protein [Cellulomonas hominis]VTR76024.1 hypothetical protein CHMI_00780 [Cellulomonas hominis]